MGLQLRPTSGKILNGSTLIVPGQPMSSSKVFPTTFQFKKGTSRELTKEYNVVSPTPTPTPTPSQTPLVSPTPLPTQTPTPSPTRF
jgi:hypothetical protein